MGPAIDTAEDATAYKHRQLSFAVGRAKGDVEAHDKHHPVTVLGWWDIAFREDYDQPSGLRITVSRAVAYLSGMLGTIAQDPEQDWPEFAREVRSCRSHLEAVLHDGEQVERGAPCPTCCDDEREEGDPEPPALVLKRAQDTSGAKDRWVCRRCKGRWTVAEYRLRVGQDHLRYADRLTASDMLRQHRIRPGSLTGWAALGKVHKRGKDESGRQLYDVADAVAMRDRRAESDSA